MFPNSVKKILKLKKKFLKLGKNFQTRKVFFKLDKSFPNSKKKISKLENGDEQYRSEIFAKKKRFFTQKQSKKPKIIPMLLIPIVEIKLFGKNCS